MVRWDNDGGPPSQVPAGLTIVPVQDGFPLEQFEKVFLPVFDIKDLLPYREGGLFDVRVLSDSRIRHWVGVVDGRPAATSTACVAGGVVGVYNVAVLADARHRGFGAAMTQVAATVAPGLPAVGGVTGRLSHVPGAGFRPGRRVRVLAWAPAGTSRRHRPVVSGSFGWSPNLS
jgi:hypothetical protein